METADMSRYTKWATKEQIEFSRMHSSSNPNGLTHEQWSSDLAYRMQVDAIAESSWYKQEWYASNGCYNERFPQSGANMKPITWSYSAAKDFESCPRKYYELRVAKNYKQEETEATRYGTEVHKAFEEFVRDGKPIPPQFVRFQHFIEPLLKLRGDKYCEHKIGVRADFSPCEFFAADVWWRGIPDLLVVNEEAGMARVVDYKTGKSAKYADTDQLELLAAAIMMHFPKVNRVKGALLFVVAGAVVKAEYTREQLPQIWSKWGGKIGRIETAQASNLWHEKQGPLCGWCPVTACAHHKPRK